MEKEVAAGTFTSNVIKEDQKALGASDLRMWGKWTILSGRLKPGGVKRFGGKQWQRFACAFQKEREGWHLWVAAIPGEEGAEPTVRYYLEPAKALAAGKVLTGKKHHTGSKTLIDLNLTVKENGTLEVTPGCVDGTLSYKFGEERMSFDLSGFKPVLGVVKKFGEGGPEKQ